MGNFHRNDRRPGNGGFERRGGGKSFGGGRGFDRRNGEKPQMYDAVCSECGNDCQVPFRPNGKRPVFCSNCFGKQQDQGGGREFRSDRGPKPYFDSRQMHDTICSKCGKPCQVPFRPEPGKSAFCDNCFQKGGNKGTASNEVMEQLKMLNAKIDRLVNALVPGTPATETKTSDSADAEKTEKPKAKKAAPKTKTAAKKSAAKKKK